MTCFSSITFGECISVVLGFILPLGVLTTTALASALSFSQNCTVRVDMLILLHNALFFTLTTVATYSKFRGPVTEFMQTLEQISGELIRMVLWLSIPMLALMVTISVQKNRKCADESGKFAIVWFYIVSCVSALLFLGLEIAELCSVMSGRRRDRRSMERYYRTNLKQGVSLIPRLLKIRGTREGWAVLTTEYAAFFMNLQDSQKESLLPVLLLYAIDELTWELREIPDRLQSAQCLICEERFSRRNRIVSCIHKPDLVHRDCLMRQIPVFRWGQNLFLGAAYVQSTFKAIDLARKWTSQGSSSVVEPNHLRLGVFGQTYLQVSGKLWNNQKVSGLRSVRYMALEEIMEL